jgi:hypothetical protein
MPCVVENDEVAVLQTAPEGCQPGRPIRSVEQAFRIEDTIDIAVAGLFQTPGDPFGIANRVLQSERRPRLIIRPDDERSNLLPARGGTTGKQRGEQR